MRWQTRVRFGVDRGPGEIDVSTHQGDRVSRMKRLFERYVLSLLGAAILAGSLLFAPAGLPGVTVCWFKRFTGLPCPGCGMTRAFCAISHGELAAAWVFHPFSFLFYGLCLLLIVQPLIEHLRPGWTRAHGLSRHWLVPFILLVIALNAFGVWRLLRVLEAREASGVCCVAEGMLEPPPRRAGP